MKSVNIIALGIAVAGVGFLSALVLTLWNLMTDFGDASLAIFFNALPLAWPPEGLGGNSLTFTQKFIRGLNAGIHLFVYLFATTVLVGFLLRGILHLIRRFRPVNIPNFSRGQTHLILLGLITLFFTPFLVMNYYWSSGTSLAVMFHDLHPNPFYSAFVENQIQKSGFDQTMGFTLDMIYLILDGLIGIITGNWLYGVFKPAIETLWQKIIPAK